MACILDCQTFTVPDTFAEQEILVNLTPKEVTDLIIYGTVTECTAGTPIVGAIVKAFACLNGVEVPITHTFSGCSGEYLINIPETFDGITIPAGTKILVKATCTTLPPTPCRECPDCNCPPPTPPTA